MNKFITFSTLTAGMTVALSAAQPQDHLVFEGAKGQPGNGKHVVLIAGDEEYRSEESMPMMAQILCKQGFKCTVLFSMDKENKFVDPDNLTSLSNPEALDSADSIILATRMRKWNDEAMDKFVAAWERGTPISALRTATHPFNHGKDSKWRKWAFSFKGKTEDEKKWNGGFGKKVLGETWISHHGRHKKEGCRTFVEEENASSSLLNGVDTIFCKSDVYGIVNATPTQPAKILLRGGVTKTLEADSELVEGKKNDPMMPVAWTRLYKHDSGKTNKIFTTTMGSADDLIDENLRRLVINSVYWGMDMKVPAKADATLQNTYEPTFYSFGGFKRNRTPSDFINVLSKASERALKYKDLKGKDGDVRYIRIEIPGNKKILTLVEVEAISGGNNIAPKGVAKQSSTNSHGKADKAIDLDKNPTWGGKALTHTKDAKGGTKNPWWELDLQQGYDISEVKIWNREENFGNRLEGFKISLLDKDRKVIFTKSDILAPKKAITISPKSGEIKYSDGTVSGKKPHVKIDGPKHPAVVKNTPPKTLNLQKKNRIAFVGGGLGSRMNLFNEFETELQRRYPQHDLYIRNMCFEGNTPAFRPHPSRMSFFVLDSLPDKGKSLVPEEFQITRGQDGDRWTKKSAGHYETPDQWLTRHNIDTVIGFFGYSESFQGTEAEDLERYKNELRAFIKHTLGASYTKNGAQVAIVGPAAYEDLSAQFDLPDGKEINKNLKAYTKAMAEVCKEEGVLFFDAFNTTKGLYASNKSNLTKVDENSTSNGHNLTAETYKKFSPVLADALFGKESAKTDYAKIKAAVSEKNRLWLLDYKIPNGVHVHGRRYRPHGNLNYPEELLKTRQMTDIRDQAIWAANKGETFDVAAADAKTQKLTPIKSNSNRPVDYKPGKEVEGLLKMAPGYKVELFACEKEFPQLANPSQMAFDNKGRLWVGCMGSYPHYRIGDPLPKDSILIFEDTNNDGKADKVTPFVEDIHIPMGFEITEHGVFVSLGNDLVLLKDTDGDDKADYKEIVISGFDDHDTHHAISSFCADPSGAIYMGEGVFSISNVETPYGTVRGTNGGFYRYNPNKKRLERTAQYDIPNPWGIAFNDWGQNFFLHTSGPQLSWMQRTAVQAKYNMNYSAPNMLRGHNVRPTSGLEFVSSRHFPEDVQGDVLICNNIGFLGCKQHKFEDDSETGFFKVGWRQDLFVSPNEYRYFRPVDLEFAPDGSLYFLDWSNVLIGHMQHNARDPKRDHVHGRIYRVTYPDRPLVTPAKIDGASLEQLLENLKLPEIRTRYRTRRELRGRDANKVLAATQKWVTGLDKSDARYEHHLLEALWVTWGINQIDETILKQVLTAKDYRARTAAVRAVRYNADKLGSNAKTYLLTAAGGEHPQVRHEALIAATWMEPKIALEIVNKFGKKPVSKISEQAFNAAKGIKVKEKKFPKHKGGLVKQEANKTVIAINSVSGLKFDVKNLNLKAGKEIELIFSNADEMPHNILVVKPGTINDVAKKAIAMGGDGFAKHFVPKDDNVIAASKLINGHEVETLKFTLKEKGVYEFVCTFPGHDKMMRGTLTVK